jgi:phage terminase large subunit-like protein
MIELLAQLERRKKIYQLEYYLPYPKQMSFHNGLGKGTDTPADQRLLLGGNQVGKTKCGSMEAAIHLTGRYPIWWAGMRYNYPITMMCGGLTNATVRDIIQKNLFGNPLDENAIGTGSIPIDCIGKPTKKVGVPNAFDSVTIKHFTNGVYDGLSNVYMRSYADGFKAFMGIGFQVGWMDEEPPADVYSQFLRAGLAQVNPILYMTMTPEEGMTSIVTQFMNDLQVGQYLTSLTWDDAQHMTEEMKVRMLSKFPEHERAMRRNGSPLMGAGLVFSTPDDTFVVDPFQIPEHWAQLCGVDFGWDHPFAATKIAWDRDNDCVYVTAEYSERKAVPAVHAVAIRAWGAWVPVAWPHDGLQHEKGTGEQLRAKYIDAGVNFLNAKATNPPQDGQKEGEGGNSVEASLLEMVDRMETGRFKVFRTCTKFLAEKSMYHRDKLGKLVKTDEDVLSSCRYAVMMLRHATTRIVHRHIQSTRKGRRNFGR